MKVKFVLSAALAAFALTAASASAGSIVGTLNIGGGGNQVMVISVLPGNHYNMDFLPLGGGNGDAFVSGGTGYFTPLPAVFSTLKNLDIADVATAGFVTAPTGAVVSIPNFLNTFVGTGLSFELTKVFASSAAACTVATPAGTPCAASAGSPFTLKQNAQGVSVEYEVAGYFHNTNGDLGFGGGTYTTQLAGQSLVQVLATLAGAGSFSSSWSASYFSAAVPEPATVLTFGLGAGLVAFLRRRQQQSEKA